MLTIRCDRCGRVLLPMEAVEVEAIHTAFLVTAEEHDVEAFELCEQCMDRLRWKEPEGVQEELLQAAEELALRIEEMYAPEAETQPGCISVDAMLRRAGKLLRRIADEKR